ncbi:MAG: methyltransferase [Candidatus Lokiarchaeota archaeon]|nr:methyltransferase [Candidatus Lokiarchaeota archaeon]MBD3339240.1 methyltransferase [Candidatus Lokiarchaeota archaeon]
MKNGTFSAIIIKKSELIYLIQTTETFKSPKVELEQYAIDAACAVDIVFFAGFEFDDISNKIVFDLGAGSGRLSIISALLQSACVLSVDIDISALEILNKNIANLNLRDKIFPICTDVKNLEISKVPSIRDYKITTIMNPPFGVQKKKADRVFLRTAFSFSEIIYSIHLANKKVYNFIANFALDFGWKVDYVFPYKMYLEKSFPFHTKRRKEIDINVFRFTKKEK